MKRWLLLQVSGLALLGVQVCEPLLFRRPASHTATELSSHRPGARTGSIVSTIQDFFPFWNFELIFRTQMRVW